MSDMDKRAHDEAASEARRPLGFSPLEPPPDRTTALADILTAKTPAGRMAAAEAGLRAGRITQAEFSAWMNSSEMPATLADLSSAPAEFAEEVMRRVEAGEVTRPEPFYDLALHATLALKRAERAREAFPPRSEAAERLDAYAEACVLLLQQVDDMPEPQTAHELNVLLGRDHEGRPYPPRSLWSRARDAWAGLVAGWRGES